MRMPGYEYDVFISYHRVRKPLPSGDERRSNDGAWVEDVLYPQLEGLLEQELGTVPAMFYMPDIRKGTRWPDELRHALLTSRCMLAVWSFPYFCSAWCRTEWHTMRTRCEAVQSKTGRRPELVYPLVYFDGENFDAEARAHLQKRNMERYHEIRDKRSRLYQDFRQEVQVVCRELAQIVRNAPEWDPEWRVEEMEGLPSAAMPLARTA